MRIVVVSATSVIAISCIKVWASGGPHEFVLVGRSKERLAATAQDLALRYSDSKFDINTIDFDSAESVEKLLLDIGKSNVDVVLIAQGALTDQAMASKNLTYLQEQLKLNAVSVALVAEAFAGLLQGQGFGKLAIVGSVAGDRGRAYNYSYGASKALIETYCQGLQQRFGGTNISVSLIKPGPTATPMTATHRGKFAAPEQVAKVIVAGVSSGRRVIYAPAVWRLVMLVVRNIPFFVFKRMKF